MTLPGPAPGGRAIAATLAAGFLLSACSTAGNTWLVESHSADDEGAARSPVKLPPEEHARVDAERFRIRSIGGETEERPSARGARERAVTPPLQGNVLGTFRNTYYDFPAEGDFTGDAVPLRDAKCGTISAVPRGFHDAVCVQGSGILKTGRTVSFAKRDCDCAEICPRTGQKICFESLDPMKYPWGRGALGTPITPLLTVAVDDALVPMNSAVYIPELDGLPRDAARTSFHDGCFVAQDRGLRVKGQHVDVFTGFAQMTSLWNGLVPTNRGVTLVLESHRCARADSPR